MKIAPQFAVLLEPITHQHKQVQKIEAALLLLFCLIRPKISAQPASQSNRQIVQPGRSGLEVEILYLREERSGFVERSSRLPVRLSPFSRLNRQAVEQEMLPRRLIVLIVGRRNDIDQAGDLLERIVCSVLATVLQSREPGHSRVYLGTVYWDTRGD